MVDETKVLVIEDNARYRHDLETVLAFFGRGHSPCILLELVRTSGKEYKGQL